MSRSNSMKLVPIHGQTLAPAEIPKEFFMVNGAMYSFSAVTSAKMYRPADRKIDSLVLNFTNGASLIVPDSERDRVWDTLGARCEK